MVQLLNLIYSAYTINLKKFLLVEGFTQERKASVFYFIITIIFTNQHTPLAQALSRQT